MKITSNRFISVLGSAVLFIGLNVMAGACKKAKPDQVPTPPDIIYSDSAKSLLFVGNSLTYFNDLPKLVADIGRAKGVEIKTEMVAYGNYALEDHWNDGQIQQLIATKKYDFVVIQQGPSSQSDGRISLLDYGARIKGVCTANNTKLAFFMVWPAFANFHTFDGVINNYTNAAVATNSLLCPVGRIWKDYFLATGDYSYYGPDMFHPSLAGSKDAARIIYETLF